MSDQLSNSVAKWKARNQQPKPAEAPTTEIEEPAIDLRSVLDDEPELEQSAPDPAESEPVPRPRPRTPRSRTPSGAAGVALPPPVYRVGVASLKRSVDVPLDYETLRRDAKAAGMTATHLILSALAAHGPTLRTEAQTTPFLQQRQPTKGWTLLISEEELAELDQLVDVVAGAFGKHSRAAVVAELLSRCIAA